MKIAALVLCAVFTGLAAGPAAAQQARPGDKSVAKLIDKAIDSVEDFEKRLDPNLRKGTIRGASVDVDVKRYLEDFDEDLERLRKRFKADYSASAEATAVLRRANGIDRYMKSQSAALKGRSEWDVASASLDRLAAAYGTTFPTSEEPTARRINDREIEQAAAAIMQQAPAYKKGLKDGFAAADKDALKAAQANVDKFADAAKTLKSRVGSDKPASGEAGVLMENYAVVAKDGEGKTMSEPATKAAAAIAKAVATIKGAFGIS